MNYEKIISEGKFIDLECLSELRAAVNDASSPERVYIGEGSAPVSAKAYDLLSSVQKKSDEVRYLVYSDGESVGVAYDEDKYEASAAGVKAVYCIVEKLKRGESLSKGVVASGAIEPVAYFEALDAAQNEECYKKMRETVGGELGEAIVDATKQYFSIMSEGVVDWISGLYDPNIGGFYYSESARDHEGYLPDLESTGQAMCILQYNNMLDHIGGTQNLPDFMKKQIISFVKPLQDPNGYFYHPQWTKERTDRLVERRARDLCYALGALSSAGGRPTYDTPTGEKGDGKLIDGREVDPCGIIPTEKPSSAEKTEEKPAERYVSPILKDKESFVAYLEANREKITKCGYGFGSELCSQIQEIKHRDMQLKEKGADYSLMEILTTFLSETQNPTNGTWYSTDRSDPEYSDYHGVNALLKISGLYRLAGLEFPNALAACKSAITAIYTDEDPLTMCYAYNAWFSVENIIKNLESCAHDPRWGKQKVDEIRRELLLDAPRAILTTMEKLKKFRKSDGSFSYFQTGSCCTSNDMWVAIKDTNEGDVNASVIGGIDVSDRMYFVLGLERPKILGRAAYCKFIDNIKNPRPIIKKPAPYEIPR